MRNYWNASNQNPACTLYFDSDRIRVTHWPQTSVQLYCLAEDEHCLPTHSQAHSSDSLETDPLPQSSAHATGQLPLLPPATSLALPLPARGSPPEPALQPPVPPGWSTAPAAPLLSPARHLDHIIRVYHSNHLINLNNETQAQ